jgi:hypothetical protein
LTNVTISGNSADGASGGGGMYNEGSSPVLTNEIISGNSATATYSRGGGMYNFTSSSPVLTNVAILGNTATGIGGGIANFAVSSPTLTNVTIAGNSVTGSGSNGGGMANSDSSPKVRNSIIWGNEAASGKGISANGSGYCSVTYSIVQEITNWLSLPSGITNGSGNIADPGSGTSKSPFVAWIDPAGGGWVPTSEGNYRLKDGSPAIDAGNDSLYPPSIWSGWETWITTLGITNPVTQTVFEEVVAPALAKDLAGNPRIQGTEIDMGAYEKE